MFSPSVKVSHREKHWHRTSKPCRSAHSLGLLSRWFRHFTGNVAHFQCATGARVRRRYTLSDSSSQLVEPRKYAFQVAALQDHAACQPFPYLDNSPEDLGVVVNLREGGNGHNLIRGASNNTCVIAAHLNGERFIISVHNEKETFKRSHKAVFARLWEKMQSCSSESQPSSHLRDGAEAENFGVLDLSHVGKAIRHQCQCVRYELVQTP